MSRYVIAAAGTLHVQKAAEPYELTLVLGEGAMDLDYEDCRRLAIDIWAMVLKEPDMLACMESYKSAVKNGVRKPRQEPKTKVIRNRRKP
jgi:hypothetical protein